MEEFLNLNRLSSVEVQTVLDLDEDVSLSRRPDRFLNHNWIILGWISDKVLNLDNFPPSKCGRVLKSQQNYPRLNYRQFLDLDEDVSLSQSTDWFLNLNWVSLGRITDKVLNLDNFPPSKCGRVLKSQQNYPPLKYRQFLDLDEDVSLSRSTDRFLNLNWIILGLILDKVLNLDNFPPSKCGRVLKSQQNYPPLKYKQS